MPLFIFQPDNDIKKYHNKLYDIAKTMVYDLPDAGKFHKCWAYGHNKETKVKGETKMTERYET